MQKIYEGQNIRISQCHPPTILKAEAKEKCVSRYMFLCIFEELILLPEVTFENIIDVFASIKSRKQNDNKFCMG
jgi:hypothetical protein